MYFRQKLKLLAKSLVVALTFMGLTLFTPAIAQAATSPDCKNPTSKGLAQCLQKSPIVKRMQQIVNFLSAAVGVIVVGTIIFGGIQYILAGDNANAVTAAKQRIINGFIALLAFLLIFAFLQWIIPGGVFKR